jgi:chemotaxis protein histidine kinase CheA
MSHLEALKERLKHKPEVRPIEGVRVILAPPSEERAVKLDKVMPLITAEKDEGKRAQEILEKIKQKKLSNVIKKLPEEPKMFQETKAPIIEDKKKRKNIKLREDIIIQEEPEQFPEELPEGGPRLEEMVLEKENVKEVPMEVVLKEEHIKAPRKRTTVKQPKGVIPLGTDMMVQIGDTPLPKRLPPLPIFNVSVSSYYMNNREIFVNFINNLFEPYKEDLLDETKNITCEDISKDTGEIGLLTHQKIVRDYMNLYTPYRGLLLYHGLGAGKTCASIAIVEAMKSSKKIIIMTPASLRRNYIEEIKKCGDLLYRKNQYWEWISIDDNPILLNPLSKALGFEHNEYVKRQHGAWLVNITKPSNYTDLSASDKKSLNDQLDEMISNKYQFINYNGLRRDRFRKLTKDFQENIFDNSCVIIDEAHNLISRIVNKINKISKYSERKRGPGSKIPQALSLILYEFLLKADNCRVVLLTGTPIINYPNEIGILFNILRGYIKTWNLTLSTETNKKLSKETLQELFSKEKLLDYIDYVPSSKTLTITRNPYGFENKITANSGYKGVTNEKKEKINEKGMVEKDANGKIIYNERGQVSDADFIQRIVKLLKKNDINAISKGTTYDVYTALPDTLDEFINIFIDKDTGTIHNLEKFKRRIIGLTSYFRSAQEELLPAYDRNFDRHEVYVKMSDYQFKVYEEYRVEERERETTKSKKKEAKVDADGIFKEPSSTYRIFSRLACNFVMPSPPGRPNPAQYRVIADKTYSQNLFQSMKEKYFKDNDEYDEDMQQKIKEFIEQVQEEYLNDSKIRGLINVFLGEYIVEYIKDDYREPIQTYFRKRKQDWLFDKVRQRPSNEELELIVKPYDIKVELRVDPKLIKVQEKDAKARAKAEEKEAKEKAKAEEKEAKEKAKAEEKAEKEKAKAEEKAEKEKARAEEKAEKERIKAEEKEAKARAKAEEKAEKERLKAEEKERRKAEKVKKGGKLEDEDADDEDSDDEDAVEVGDEDSDDDDDNEVVEEALNGGSSNLAEEFVDEHADNELLPIHLEDYKDEDAILREADELEGDEILEQMGSIEYKEAIKAAMRYLQLHSREFLSPEGLKTYSPKFLAMLDNIEDPEHQGLHLIYSQFRSMEGIGIFCLVLEANGFAKFKIKRTGTDGWELNMSEEDMGKPCYALYTGTEDSEEREILRNIYNGAWDYIPNNIATQLRAKSSNNNLGEIIKVLMITSAGSEGINLRNTRYVHIMEPYWHPVRLEQVIGRARRICSHQSLPKELQTVEVFIYIMTFTKEQLDSDFAIELKLKDLSKISPYFPQTSDQKLFEISTIKEQLTSQLLKAVKETSIDCATHIKSSTKEGLVCLSFGQPNVNNFAYNPSIAQDENDTVADLNKFAIDWEARPFTLKTTGKRYMLRMDTRQVYDYDSVIQAKEVPGVRPILIGKLVKNEKNEYEIVKDKT